MVTNINRDLSESTYYHHIERCKNFLNNIQSDADIVETLKQEEKFLREALAEYKILKREIEEINREIDEETSFENSILNSKSKSKAVEVAKLQEEISECKKLMSQWETIKHNENILKLNTKDQLFFQTNIESALKETNLLQRIEKNFEFTINNIKSSADRDENASIDNIILKKYCTLQVFSGIKIIELNDDSKYKIAFRNLPDECLEFKKIPCLSKLSSQMIDSYKSLFEKRNLKFNQDGIKSIVKVDNTNDYKIISKNYINLLCFVLTKQEIEQATKKFTIDWINGSNVLTYNIGAQASKQATIVLPLYYPLCGTSNIKLTSLSGYEGSNDDLLIKNFAIKNNLSSLSEWITVFTEMFYAKKII